MRSPSRSTIASTGSRPKTVSLTPASADLLNKIEFELFDDGESGEAPFYHGELSKAEAGNLLDLKKKGLVTTHEEENGWSGQARLWISLTDKYRARYIPNRESGDL